MGIPFFKEPKVAAKVRRGLQRSARKSRLDAEKDVVRRRDKSCRVPLCGCKRFNLVLHVSHAKHQGIGGNPAEDRNDPALLVLVCAARHREHAVSIDRGTLKWRALTSAGANGPIQWAVDLRELMDPKEVQRRGIPAKWFVVATENGIGTCDPFTDEQKAVLTKLRGMTL